MLSVLRTLSRHGPMFDAAAFHRSRLSSMSSLPLALALTRTLSSKSDIPASVSSDDLFESERRSALFEALVRGTPLSSEKQSLETPVDVTSYTDTVPPLPAPSYDTPPQDSESRQEESCLAGLRILGLPPTTTIYDIHCLLEQAYVSRSDLHDIKLLSGNAKLIFTSKNGANTASLALKSLVSPEGGVTVRGARVSVKELPEENIKPKQKTTGIPLSPRLHISALPEDVSEDEIRCAFANYELPHTVQLYPASPSSPHGLPTADVQFSGVQTARRVEAGAPHILLREKPVMISRVGRPALKYTMIMSRMERDPDAVVVSRHEPWKGEPTNLLWVGGLMPTPLKPRSQKADLPDSKPGPYTALLSPLLAYNTFQVIPSPVASWRAATRSAIYEVFHYLLWRSSALSADDVISAVRLHPSGSFANVQFCDAASAQQAYSAFRYALRTGRTIKVQWRPVTVDFVGNPEPKQAPDQDLKKDEEQSEEKDNSDANADTDGQRERAGDARRYESASGPHRNARRPDGYESR